MPPKTKSAPAQTAEASGNKLVIVESPAKAKTIEGYLGKDFRVVSCYGHIRDLPKNNNAIDIQNHFQPTYEVSSDKKEVIKELKRLAQQSSLIYLASDDDREGEAISWHLKEALNLKDKVTQRIVFREITKNAILNAIQNPRTINQDLVNAQQARRVLDRLVGFELSPILWKKIKAGLSAGRVQSVAVRLVVEREREIQKFAAESSFRVIALFDVGAGRTLKAELPQRFATEAEAEGFLRRCTDASYSILDLQKKEGRKSPSAPFTTSTLQQEASRKLGFSVTQTMSLAQKLYEAGKITYMRTDSLNLSKEAMSSAAQEIKRVYGPEFSQPRDFKTKSDLAQEAHEAIRPTDFSVTTAGADRNEKALYEMIWKRAIASQMSEARIEKTVAQIGISGQPEQLVATGEVIRFEGFLKVYIESNDDEDQEDSRMLPPLTVGQILTFEEMTARETFTKAAARYTEASLVKKLEELGIGRPSTYAPTISTIEKRGYVVKESREGRERKYRELTLKGGALEAKTRSEITGTEKQKLFPTDLAKVVTDFLTEHFEDIVSYSFTAQVEKEFDEIARGQKVWNEVIGEFYRDFHPKIEKSATVDRAAVGTVRELGLDPKTGLRVLARLGRFGPVAQIGGGDDEEKPRYASLEKQQSIDTITLEEALELFKLPQTIGEFESHEIVVAKGRFGPYVRHDGKFYSIPRGEDPLEVTEERAVQIIVEKREADARKLIKAFPENPEIQVLNGRFGPYIKTPDQNVRIPKDKEASALTFEEVMVLVNSSEKKPAKRATKAAATKTTAAKASKTTKATKTKVAAKASKATKTTKTTETKTKAATPKTAAAKAGKTTVKKTVTKAPAKKAATKTAAK